MPLNPKANSTYPGKGFLDITVTTITLVVGLPFFLLILLVHILLFGRSAFFRQARIFSRNREFYIYKIRTIYDHQEIGRFRRYWLDWLRRLSVDEFPQLFQVLGGKMSLIGPRPLVPEFRPYIERFLPERFNVKPGLTGWAQVNGGRSLPLAEKLKLDKEYIARASLQLDLIIIFKTMAQWFRTSAEDARDLQELEQWKN